MIKKIKEYKEVKLKDGITEEEVNVWLDELSHELDENSKLIDKVVDMLKRDFPAEYEQAVNDVPKMIVKWKRNKQV
jgi:hypothetical protein